MSMKDSRGNSGLMFLMFPRNGRPGGEGISTVPSMFVLVVSLMVVDVMRESRPEPVLTRVKRKGYDLEDVGDVADLETQRREGVGFRDAWRSTLYMWSEGSYFTRVWLSWLCLRNVMSYDSQGP
jgi:hypothetical protein